jgi:hypothetical protein
LGRIYERHAAQRRCAFLHSAAFVSEPRRAVAPADQIEEQPRKLNTVILRRARALARDRLEGWKQAPRLLPSFETRPAGALRMTWSLLGAPSGDVLQEDRQTSNITYIDDALTVDMVAVENLMSVKSIVHARDAASAGTLARERSPTDRAVATWSGRLLHIHIAEAASYEMEELAEANCVAGKGIEGDRYFKGIGTYSPKPDVREVTLIEMEVLEAMARGDPPFPGEKVTLEPIDHRRNLTTRGVPLNHLVGKRFKVGNVVLKGGRLNFPCKYLEELLGLPVYTPLLNRSGLNCSIEIGGIIRKGDPIVPVD